MHIREMNVHISLHICALFVLGREVPVFTQRRTRSDCTYVLLVYIALGIFSQLYYYQFFRYVVERVGPPPSLKGIGGEDGFSHILCKVLIASKALSIFWHGPE